MAWGGSRLRKCWFATWLGLLLTTAQNLRAQAPAEGMVSLNLAGDIELRVLVDYVSQRLGVNILYDEQIANKKVTVKAPGAVPTGSLLAVLENALKMKELMLVDADAPGWKRIVATANMPTVAVPEEPAAALKLHGPSIAVTQAFPLKHADVQKVDQAFARSR